MPNKDGTGPEGKGPRTGRGRGNCESDESESRKGRGQRLGCCPKKRCDQED